MISVIISINSNPVMARSAVNTERETPDGSTIYKVDIGEQIIHRREDGAVALAIKLLKTIRE